MTDQELATALAYLVSVYPGQEWNQAQCSIWVDVIDDFDPVIVDTGLRSMARTERFPSVAAFVEHCETAVRERRPVVAGSLGYVNGELDPTPGEVADRDSVVASLTEARKRLRNGVAS